MFGELLERIRRDDRRLKAFVCIADNAPAAGERSGPLSDVAIAIKDLIDTADFPTSYGSPIYANHRPLMDAGIVAALKESGAFIAGKTTTTEFATWPPTATLNPHHPAHTPGGSSAGSAAAVGAGLVPAAIGSQTKGSVIRPASFCGVVGFKPSFNRLPRAGVKMLAESLDTIGIFANSVALAERIYLTVTAETPAPAPVAHRYAFCRTPQWPDASTDARAAIEGAIEKFRTTGIPIDDLRLPDSFSDISHDAGIVHDYEMRRSLLPEFRTSRGMIDPSLAAAIESASSITGEQYGRALDRLEARRNDLADALGGYDAILCLAAPGEAPEGLTSTGSPVMNTSWTALYLLCITLPVLRGAKGLPIGLQLVGRRNRDTQLLQAAFQLEQTWAEIP